MVNKITTPPTQNEVIDKINELVDGKQDTITSSNKLSASLVSGLSTVATSGSYNDLSNKPTVDQTYSATSANAQSGVAVASAIGNGSVTINQGGTPRGTFTMNQSSNLTIDLDGTSGVSAIAILNKNTDSPYQTLGIWQGTEYQWNHANPTMWYYWKTNTTGSWVSGGNLQDNRSWLDPIYGNGSFVTLASSSDAAAYSTDGGATWQSATLPSSGSWNTPVYGNDRFLTVTKNSTKSAYSTDGGATWQSGGTLPNASIWYTPVYSNGRFVITSTGISSAYSTDGGATWQNGGTLPSSGWGEPVCDGGNNIVIISNNNNTDAAAYSTDGGTTWQSATLPSSGSWNTPVYGNDRFLTVTKDSTNKAVAYSTDGGATWQSGGTLPYSGKWNTPAYGDGRFVITRGNFTYAAYYSDDDGMTWHGASLPTNTYYDKPVYGGGVFVIKKTSSDVAAYSTDGGTTWQSATLPSSDSWNTPAYGDGRFVTVKPSSTDSAIFASTYDKCYTDTTNPTTTSVVYSTPNTESALTISSVTSGAITLSNNNTYYYNQSGNVQTYDTIGNTHPEYLCFIDGVGVKIGNTTIATNTPITTTITSSSTDTEAPSAKAVYDALNP